LNHIRNYLKPKNIFFIFLFLHTLIWTLVPLFTRISLHHDVLEGIAQGMSYQLGYSKHPFLSMWLVASVWQFIGEHDWIMYLFSQIVMGIGFYFIWKLNYALLPPWKALVATLISDGLVIFNINANILTPDTLQIPCWAAIGYYLYKLTWHPTRKNWMLLGFLFGIGFLIKYQIIVLLVPTLFFIYLTPVLRKQLFTLNYLSSVLVFLLTISPHVFWMIKSHFANFAYTHDAIVHEKGHSYLQLILFYLENTLAFCMPVIVLYLITFLAAKTKKQTMSSLNQKLIYCLSWGPWLTTLVLVLTMKLDIYARWMTPYFSFLGTFLLSVIPVQLKVKHLYRFGGLFSAGTVILVMTNFFRPVTNPHCDAFYPNKEIAKFIHHAWEEEVHQPLQYVGGSRYLVAAIIPYIAPAPKPFFSLDAKQNPWIELNQLRKKGGVLVWDIQSNYAWDDETLFYGRPPENLKGVYPFLKDLKTQVFYTPKKRSIEIAYAILLPEKN